MRVIVDGIDDDDFAAELAGRDVGTAHTDADIVFLGVEQATALSRLPRAGARVADGGALWVVYPKGVRVVTQNEVLAAGRAQGLLDVKVVSFSPTHTGLRFVAPRAKR